MKNPGYILDVRDEIKIRLSLKSMRYVEEYENAFNYSPEINDSLEPPCLSVVVYEIAAGNKFK